MRNPRRAAIGVTLATLLGASGAGQAVVLYDQFDDPGGAVASQQFPDLGNAVVQPADDFVVPAGDTWYIDGVNARGQYSTVGGPAPAVDVIFYADAGGFPGAVECNYQNLPYADLDGSPTLTLFDIDLPTPCILGPGIHWVSVMADMPFFTLGQWFWGESDTLHGNPARWQDPSALINPNCPTWADLLLCIGITAPDFLFQIEGAVNACPCFGLPALALPFSFGTCQALGLWAGGYTQFQGWPAFSAQTWTGGCWYSSPFAPDVIVTPIPPGTFHACRATLLTAASNAGVSCPGF